MIRERLVVGAVHYAAGPIGRVSHGPSVVVTAPEATERRREVVNSVRASFLFCSLHPTLSFGESSSRRERVGVRVFRLITNNCT